ncbi:MAG: hypothetical protein HOK30_09395 [Rhodospirillaceae bacterium]|nr:hypothetical protein [Rhodospirillaceae bacterium]MBT5896881.1 hypothetical protein [Rhodospirillaceae bacterium]MBT6427862.1 hypothetical protein [Rhodospirillaceae bacterium]MBT7758728.1 hypothetical protein [Rhodospirillaceae bacterium]
MNKAAEGAAVAAAQAFLLAFNAQDHAALAASLNYPHVRLAVGKFVTYDSAEAFLVRCKVNKAQLEAEGWHHTNTNVIEIIQSGPDKVHLRLEIDRCHEDDTVYNKFDTLWIATRQDGHWGIQFRSSYLR